MSAKPKVVAVNERGRRIGESHPRAKLTDHEIDLIRQLHEDEGMSYGEIARKFEDDGGRPLAKSTVQHICTYRKRAQTTAGFKRTR